MDLCDSHNRNAFVNSGVLWYYSQQTELNINHAVFNCASSKYVIALLFVAAHLGFFQRLATIDESCLFVVPARVGDFRMMLRFSKACVLLSMDSGSTAETSSTSPTPTEVSSTSPSSTQQRTTASPTSTSPTTGVPSTGSMLSLSFYDGLLLPCCFSLGSLDVYELCM